MAVPTKERTPRSVLMAVTVLAPVVLFALVEAGLRLAGIGAREPLFIPVAAAPDWLQPNPAVIQRFFPHPGQAPRVSIDTTYFAADKPANSFRVFVQGESSAAGFPYGRWASPGALLEQRLQASVPEREVEVVSTAMSAVTSYVLLDFADEIIAARPDAIVIYTGHNEFLGIGGVGSSYASASSPALARAIAALRHLHSYRALERLLSSPGDDLLRTAAEGTLMARVAREREIPLGSPLYQRGLEQFEGNLERLLAKYRAAGIPVFIGTLASNERDQPPFAGGPTGGDDRGLAAARAALAAGDAAGAEARFAALVARDADWADAYYGRAQALELLGRFAAARDAYRAAKDRDRLRFRAPEEFNTLIRRVAAATGAAVVDVQAALTAAAPAGIIGRTLMLEHLHPNVDGYFRLASAYYPALLRLTGASAVPEDIARRESPVTALDRLAGEYRVELLQRDWPFVPARVPYSPPAPRDRIEELAQAWFAGRLSWFDTMNAAMGEYQRRADWPEAARVAVNVATGFRYAAQPQFIAGRLLLHADEPARASIFLRRAVALDPAAAEPALTLAEAQFRLGRRADSRRTLEAVLARHPDDPRPRHWLQVIDSASTGTGAPH